MQAHGGRIELTPLPRGTCFTVSLPVEADILDPSLAGPHLGDSRNDGDD